MNITPQFIGLVAIGAAFGATSRLFCSLFLQKWVEASHFYVMTLSVNLLGCLLIGIAAQVDKSSPLYPLLLIGFLASFTTFSTFSLENLMLLEQKRFLDFTLNFFISTLMGLFLVLLGRNIAS